MKLKLNHLKVNVDINKVNKINIESMCTNRKKLRNDEN